MALKEKSPELEMQLADLNIDIDSLEISDFLDESRLSSAEELSNVMAASCTTCECSCSIS